MNTEAFAHIFPLGSHLCREPMPRMSELKADMANLKWQGFNLVKLQENWQVDEPLEGRVDLSRYEELIACAARLDLGVYLGFTCEQAPHWLWRKHPACRMVGRNGLPIAYEAQATLPADGKPGPCYDHAGARADMLRFVKQAVATLGRHENIVVWNTWQEIGYWAEGLVGQAVCYCENTLAFYREWLCSKYGDLDGLNRAWNARYLDWEAVQPDRCARPLPLPQGLDWRYFIDNVQVARVLRERAHAIREADPFQRPVLAHRGAPIIGSGQDWVYARCQDFLGSSCYPAWGSGHRWDDMHPSQGRPADRHTALLAEMWDSVALRYDYVRCCNVPGCPVWAAEFQGGPVSTDLHKGRVPSPAEIRRWVLTAIGSGVTAISFWVTRAEIAAQEVNGFGLLDSVGDSTPRYEEAARIGRALNQHADLFARPTRPCSQVAILINERNYVFCQTMNNGREHLAYSVRGWYRLLWDLGIAVDFVEASELDEEYARRYKALILPFPLCLSEDVASRLSRYVEQGGNLICEACPGRITEHAYANRGELSPIMAQLLGVAHESLTLVREPGEGRRWSFEERTWGEYVDPVMLAGAGPLAGGQVRANLYIETFACQGSQPCLRYGEQVAGVVHDVGLGRAWVLGTLVGHVGTAYREEASRCLVRVLLSQCGVTSEHQGELLLRRRIGVGRQAWLFTNPADHPVTESIDVAGWPLVSDLLGESLDRRGNQVALSVPSLDVRVLIVGQG